MATELSLQPLGKSGAGLRRQLNLPIHRFADRAFELQRLAKTLKERASRTYAEKGVQADQTSSGVIAPAYRKLTSPLPAWHLDRSALGMLRDLREPQGAVLSNSCTCFM
jgi:hypothetical protein